MDTETKTKLFLHRVLKDHYTYLDRGTSTENMLYLPPRFTLREFAFLYSGSRGMHRPVRFGSKEELMKFMIEKTPLHTYYSTAYYSNPEAPMKDKDWLGADLVFDLDADHLPGGEDIPYTQQLELVKKKTYMLLHDFLLDDLGFNPDDISLNFSGHRGYHIHIRRGDILNMSRNSRRELVDYITGRGLDLDTVLPSKQIVVDQFKDHKKTVTSYELPPKEAGGWMKKIRIMIGSLLERWASMPEEEVTAEMMEKHGMGKKRAEALYKDMFIDGKWKDIAAEGKLDTLSESGGVGIKWFVKIIEGIIEEHNVSEIGDDVVGTTDEPVTGDIKRLIRLPMSIHGGSFLCAVPLALDDLSSFNPLIHALPKGLGDDIYRIRLDRTPEEDTIILGESEYHIEDEMELPEHAVPFVLAKYKAKLL